METIQEPPTLSDVLTAREPLMTIQALNSCPLVEDLEQHAKRISESLVSIIPFSDVVGYAQQLSNEELYAIISHLKSTSYRVKRAQLQACLAIEECSARISCLEDYLARREGIHSQVRSIVTQHEQGEQTE